MRKARSYRGSRLSLGAARRFAVIAVLAGVPVSGGIAFFVWLWSVLGDPAIAAVMMGTFLLPVLPLLWPREIRSRPTSR
jgi:hypothetical protein